MTITIEKLAKELKIKPSEIMQILRKEGDYVYSSLKGIDERTANRMRKRFKKKEMKT